MTILRNHPLAGRTTLGVGGPAKILYEATSEEALIAQLESCRASREPFLILGGGSNVVISDQGVPHAVIAVATRGRSIEKISATTTAITVSAGEPWDPFVAWAVMQGFVGIECLSGIPGSVGAVPIQNVGAYGQEVSDVISEVRCYDVMTGQCTVFDWSACQFHYRDSMFKRITPTRYVVLSVTFHLRKGAPTLPTYRDVALRLTNTHATALTAQLIRDTVLAIRREKSMVIDPADPNSKSVGSFFMNPLVSEAELNRLDQTARELGVLKSDEKVPRFAMSNTHEPASATKWKVPAAWLIERAGFRKGHTVGSVGLSTRHTLAIINHGGATAEEIVSFAREVQAKVNAIFGVMLKPEPVLIGFPTSSL